MTLYKGTQKICPIITVKNGVLEQLMKDIVSGNNPVSVTELQSIETQLTNIVAGGNQQ